jgi:signal transduction histidine kinase
MSERPGMEARASARRGRGLKKVEAPGSGFLSLFGEDSATTLERLASASLPLRAEVCLVDRVGDGGHWSEAARRAAPGVDARALDSLSCRLDAHEVFGPARVGRRAGPLLLAHLGGELAEGGQFVARLRERGFGSLVAAPMRVNGELLGVVTLLGAAESPPFDREDVAYCEALAAHGAIALHEAQRREELVLALHARDELLSSIALELRDPLATLAVCLHRFARRGGVVSRELAGVRRATLRIERLLGDIAALAQLRTGLRGLRLEDHAPSALVHAALDDVRLLLGDRPLEFAPPAREPTIRCDSERVRHALGNLLGNAARWTTPTGHVSVAVQTHRHEVVFSVHDDGPALEAPELATERARTEPSTRGGRASLSVAIARELVAAQGGRLWVESGAAGNAYSFALPRN